MLIKNEQDLALNNKNIYIKILVRFKVFLYFDLATRDGRNMGQDEKII